MPRPKGTTKPNIPPGRDRLPMMRVLPVRLPQRTLDRLEMLRTLDGLTLQEHVRRAFEYYLDHIEVSIALASSDALRQATANVREIYESNGVEPPSIAPALLANHAPAPRRAAPRVTAK